MLLDSFISTTVILLMIGSFLFFSDPELRQKLAGWRQKRKFKRYKKKRLDEARRQTAFWNRFKRHKMFGPCDCDLDCDEHH